MRTRLRIVFIVLAALALVSPARAQDRARTKEVVVGLGAAPRTMVAATIVDWTTKNMLEEHDLQGVANHAEWTPRADEKVWMYDAKVVAR